MNDQLLVRIAVVASAAVIVVGVVSLVFRAERARIPGLILVTAGVSTLLLSTFLLTVADNWRQLRDLSVLAERELVIATTPLAGDKEIAEIVALSVLDSGVYHEDIALEAELRYVEVGPHTSRQQYLEALITRGVTVHNPTDHSVNYPLDVEGVNLVIPKEGPGLESIVYEHLSVTFMDALGQARDTLIWEKQELSRSVSLDPLSRTTRFVQFFTIGPGEAVVITMRTRTWERACQGAMSLSTGRKGRNMRMRVRFPDESFKAYVSFRHSQSNRPDVCSYLFEQDAVSGRINGGLLPFNGIDITWTRTGTE